MITLPRSADRSIPGALACGFALLAASALGAAEPATTPAPVPPPGHQRMLAELSSIAERTADDNPVLGTRKLRQLRQLVAAMPKSVPVAQRIQLLGALAESELNDGDTEGAIGHLERSRELLLEIPQPQRSQIQPRIDSFLATAYLRLGENRNCVARHTSASCIVPIAPAGVHVDQEPSRKAIELLSSLFETVPGRSPYHYASRWLLNIATMTLGRHPGDVPPAARIILSSDEDFPHFADVAGRAGVASFDLAGGAIADDFDGDGDLDLVTSTWDPEGQLRFWHNSSEGLSFVERTEEAGLLGLYGGLNILQADYDNDGDLDVLVLRGAWLDEAGRHPNSLLRNDCDGVCGSGVTFTDVTFATGLGEVHYPTQTAAWADYDLDGDLDLYVGNEARPDTPYPSQLFRNDGKADGAQAVTFTDVARSAGVENLRGSKGVAWGDFDGDRFPDLYVSNLHGANRLYRNRGDGTFTDVAPRLGVTEPGDSFAVWFWDVDNDGALDLMVQGYQVEGDTWGPLHLWYVVASRLGDPHPAHLPRLYRGDGRGGFSDVAAAMGVARVTLPMGANFGDLDNDGWLDFYLGTGYPGLEGLVPNAMYRNQRGKGFADVTASGGFGHLQKGHAVAFADLDGDGDQDVFEQIGGFVQGDRYVNALFENPGFGNHWIAVELRGLESNRFGVGARIRIEVAAGGDRRSIYRHVGSGGSFGANPLRQEIGLGDAGRIASLEVDWPTTGRAQRFTDLAVDRLIRLTEGVDAVEELERRPMKAKQRSAPNL